MCSVFAVCVENVSVCVVHTYAEHTLKVEMMLTATERARL